MEKRWMKAYHCTEWMDEDRCGALSKKQESKPTCWPILMGGRASFFWRSFFRSQTVGSQLKALEYRTHGDVYEAPQRISSHSLPTIPSQIQKIEVQIHKISFGRIRAARKNHIYNFGLNVVNFCGLIVQKNRPINNSCWSKSVNSFSINSLPFL